MGTAAALAALLDYPWEKPEISDPALQKPLKPLLRFVSTASLEEVQDLHTRTFDLAPSCPPYLGFHLHGESYRRGTLMARLKALYRRHGVEETGELPDHLAQVLKLVDVAADEPELAELIKEELKPGMDKLLAVAAAEEADNPYRALLTAAAHALEERAK